MANEKSPSLLPLIYGTAFKFQDTARLVEEAVLSGFRRVDTAGVTSTYREDLVGEGLAQALSRLQLDRKELSIQTKFTPLKEGKDPNIYPYDVTADIEVRVQQSVDSSLKRLKTEYLDCLLLHSPYKNRDDTYRSWRAMECFVPHKVRSIGISNVDLDTLQDVHARATIKPAVVQNLFTQIAQGAKYPTNWPPGLPCPVVPFDRDVRAFCISNAIVYQPWGLLWGNSSLLDAPAVHETAEAIGITPQVALYLLTETLNLGSVQNLCGTKNVKRMQETIDGYEKFQRWLIGNHNTWDTYVSSIREIADN